MAKQERRGFSREFKIEAVRAASAGDKAITQVARELGIRPDQIHRWRRQLAERAGAPAAEVFPGKGKLSSEDEEMRRMRREIAQLREERDILKKATAFFAKESR